MKPRKAPAYLRIQVIQDDIDNGKVGDIYHCPIANALGRRRGFNQDDGDVSVDNEAIELFHGSLFSVYDLPQTARDFIQKFDGGEPVEPFSFIAPRADP